MPQLPLFEPGQMPGPGQPLRLRVSSRSAASSLQIHHQIWPLGLIYVLLCPMFSGFSGEVCQIDIDECSSTPCLNGAKCIDRPNGYDCECAEGKHSFNQTCWKFSATLTCFTILSFFYTSFQGSLVCSVRRT